MIRKVLFAAVFTCLSAAAGAATPVSVTGPTLSVDKGTVMVNNGSQYVTAKPGQALKAGDRIMVMEGGHATLNYGNGIKSSVNSGSLFSVGMAPVAAKSSLPTNMGSSLKVGPMYAAAPGDGVVRKKPPVSLWIALGAFAVVTAVAVNQGNSDGISQP